MRKLEDKLLLLTFALEDDDALKSKFKAGKLTSDQYLECTDLKSKFNEVEIKEKIEIIRTELQTQRDEAETAQKEKESLKEEKKEQQRQKLDNAKEARDLKTKEAKENFRKNKQKYKKFGIIGTILVVLLIIFGAVGTYVVKNYIGFTDVDLGSMVIIEYSTDGFSADPYFTWNGAYYSDSGYYDDFKANLKDSGIYTDEEIEALIPTYDSQVYSAISSIYQGYDVSTEENLANGETIEVAVSYNEEMAKQLKLNVTNNVVDFEIKGLKERVTMSDITAGILDQLGGNDAIQQEIIDDNESSSWSGNYEYTIPAVKFYFEDIQSDADYDEYQSFDYVYLLKEVYTENTDRDPNFDVCVRKYDIYKQNGEVILVDDVYDSCVSTDQEKLNDAIDESGSHIGIADDAQTIEGLI